MKRETHWGGTLRILAICSLELSFPNSCSIARGEDDALPAGVEVAAGITPGKPGAVTETIRMVWDGKQGGLEVTRGEGAKAQQEKVTLPEAEVRKVWRIVVADELRSFEPNESPGQVFDFGKRQLEVAVTTSVARPISRHSVSWDKPLSNEAKVEPLYTELGRLAALYGKRVQLYYFQPPDTVR